LSINLSTKLFSEIHPRKQRTFSNQVRLWTFLQL
jgi:hypothetical protein